MTMTIEQRTNALQRANYVRLSTFAVRYEMAEGTLSFADAVRDPRAQRMSIDRLVLAVPGVGKKKCRHALRAIAVTERRRVEQLTDRQLRELVHIIDDRTV